MNKVLIFLLLGVSGLSNAAPKMFPFNDRVHLYMDSISTLNNPKRVNYTVKFITDEGYSDFNLTILCNNQTEYKNSMMNYDHNGQYIDSYYDKDSMGKGNAEDIRKNSLSYYVHKKFCLSK